MLTSGPNRLRSVLLCSECEPRANRCPACGGAFLVDEHGSRNTKYEQATHEPMDAQLLA
jgi:hypothetical protein